MRALDDSRQALVRYATVDRQHDTMKAEQRYRRSGVHLKI